MSDPNSPPTPRLIGQSSGPIASRHVLGVGGMGRVYPRVRPNGESVALKVVKAELASDETFRKRFEREARVAQQVKHPNVVEVLDTGQQDSIPYLAQRYVGAGDLQADPGERHAADRDGADRLRPDRRRPRRGARAWAHPPRREAGEHPPRRGRRARTSPTSASPRTPRAACSRAPARRSARSTTWRPEQIRGEEVGGDHRRLRPRLRPLRVPHRHSRRSPTARGCGSCGPTSRTRPAEPGDEAQRPLGRARHRRPRGPREGSRGSPAERQRVRRAGARRRRSLADDRQPRGRHSGVSSIAVRLGARSAVAAAHGEPACPLMPRRRPAPRR